MQCFSLYSVKSHIFILEVIQEALPGLLSVKFKNSINIIFLKTGFTLINEVLDFAVYTITL